PAFESNNIPIVFSCSNYFSVYSSVYIKSIIKNSSSQNNYDIIIFEKEISKENKKMLLSMISGMKNFSIRFYNPKAFLLGVNFYVNSENQSEEAYYRILAPYILQSYDKIIVTDADLIVTTDIAELLKIDLNNKSAAIALDAVWHGLYNEQRDIRKYVNTKFPMKNPYNYVNTGVIVFDNNKFITNYGIDYVIKFVQKENFIIQEQDALNLMMEGDIEFLDISWNFYVHVNDNIKKLFENYSPIEIKKIYYKASKNPKIIHWASQPKPWTEPTIDLANIWWDLCSQTPFYHIVIDRLILNRIGALHPAVFDLQNRMGIFDNRSGARKLADRYFPKGSKKREILKKIIPRNSLRWRLSKRVYNIFRKK
ncbi:MAG: glycosyltransferase family 8 protein, partial [Peptostreptococcaceae bacterium]|nr:glycosyltransferase family 8 protein [Peptostreptococcaceae bacterium]